MIIIFPFLIEITIQIQTLRITLLDTGEMLHQANQNLPAECCALSHSLPLLLERAAGQDATQRMRATQAITALLFIARTRLNARSLPTSQYLAHIIRCSPKTKERIPKVQTATTSAKLSKVCSVVMQAQ